MDEARPIPAEDVPYVRADEAALEEIVRIYGRLIRRAIRRAGGRDAAFLADDIEQTVIVSLWQQISREQTIDHPASYIFKAAIRETVRAVRRERAHEERATTSDAPPGVQQPTRNRLLPAVLENVAAISQKRLKGPDTISPRLSFTLGALMLHVAKPFDNVVHTGKIVDCFSAGDVMNLPPSIRNNDAWAPDA